MAGARAGGYTLKLEPNKLKQAYEDEIRTLKEFNSTVSNELLTCKTAVENIHSELRRVLIRYITQKSQVPPSRDKKQCKELKLDIEEMVFILKNEIVEQRRENEMLKRDIVSIRKSPIKMHERAVLQKGIQEKDRELQHMSDIISELKKKRNKLEQHHKDCETKYKNELWEEQERGRKQSEASKVVQRDALEQIQTLKDSKEKIQNDLEATQIKCATVESELEEFKRKHMKQCRATIQQHQSDLEGKVSHIRQLSTANDELQKDKKALKIKIQLLNEHLQSRDQSKEQKGQVTSESFELKSILEDREKEKTEFLKQLNEMEQTLRANEIGYKDQLVRARKTSERLKNQLESATHENELMKIQIQEFQEELVTARKSDETIESAGALDKHHREIKAYQTQIETYKNELLNKNDAIKNQQKDLVENQHKCEELSKQLSDEEDNAKVLKKEFQKQIKELNAQRDELIVKQRKLMTMVRDKEEQLKGTKHRSEMYDSKIAELHNEIENMQQEWEKAKSLSEESEKNISELETNIEKLTSSLAQEKRKAEYTQTQMNKVVEKLRQANDELRNKRQTIECLTDQLRKTKDVTSQSQVTANPQESENDILIKDLQHLVEIKERMFQHDKRILEKQLKELLEENRTLVEANELHSRSLALTMDDRALENICIQNRPIKIAENYMILIATFWPDANSSMKEVTAEANSDMDRIMLLFDILMICEKEATQLYKPIIQDLQITLENPFDRYEACETSGGELPVEGSVGPLHHVITVIEDYFRSNAHRVDLRELRQRVEATVRAKYGRHRRRFISTSLQLDDVSRFVTESVRISWKMALQRPSMLFDASKIGQPWQKEDHLDLIEDSEPDAEDAVIQYYKGPTLLHAGNIMVNGSVFVHRNKYHMS